VNAAELWLESTGFDEASNAKHKASLSILIRGTMINPGRNFIVLASAGSPAQNGRTQVFAQSDQLCRTNK
jgi:hypothetical protein